MKSCGITRSLPLNSVRTIDTWKGYDWAAIERLHDKGYIADPKSKNKSVLVTPEGAKKAKELFEQMFAKLE